MGAMARRRTRAKREQRRSFGIKVGEIVNATASNAVEFGNNEQRKSETDIAASGLSFGRDGCWSTDNLCAYDAAPLGYQSSRQPVFRSCYGPLLVAVFRPALHS